ncbi:hypothetical protein GDO78_016189, partial [Eleutherodactylus coqui]
LVTPVISMQLMNGRLGHFVDFTLPVSLPSEYRIHWNFGYAGKVTVIVMFETGEPAQYNPLYKGRCELFVNGTMRLHEISYADGGTYIVKLYNPDTFTSYVQRYQLNIYGMLSAPVLKSNSPLISGTNVTLHCDAGNQNVTTYTFYHNQNIISSESRVTSRGSFLDYKPISENDSGSYSCTIQNPISSSTSNSIIVTVSVPVSSVTLTSDTSGLLWPGIDSVSLHCSARGTNVSYSWSMDDEPLPENPRYHLSQNNSTLIINPSTLTISPVSKNDTGPFTCSASNLINSETSNELTLGLNWYPKGNIGCIVQGHDSLLQLDCNWPGGHPAANVTMIFNNIEEMGQSKVTRNVSLTQDSQRSTLTCIG